MNADPAPKGTLEASPDAHNVDTVKEDRLNEAIGVLTRREVEARLLKPLMAALAERFGADAVHEVVREVVKQEARQVGQSMRHASPGSDLESFAAQWEPWFRGGALEIEELERNSERWNFNVTRCRYAELYRALGMEQLGATMSCNRDAALVEGFAEDVVLERSQTIMEGASCCDFRYRRQQPESDQSHD